MPKEAVTTAASLKFRISEENLAAVRQSAAPHRTPVTSQINMILDGWRENLKSGSKLPTGKKARK